MHDGSDHSLIKAICDTLVPADAVDGTSDGQTGLLGWGASDVGVDDLISAVLPLWSAHVQAKVGVVLDALRSDFVALSADERASRWVALTENAPTRPGALILQTTVLSMYYIAPDESGSNPTWEAIGYSGPLLDPPSEEEFPKTLAVLRLPDGSEAVSLSADVVVVGSGAGGGVAAARLAEGGLRVLVLERGSYRNEPDLPQLEALSFPNLYLGGGFIWSDDASIGLLAGSTVGGGTTVNSMACLETPEYVLEEWAESGMRDAEPVRFGPHVRSVMDRINARTTNTVHNENNRILNRGLDALGLARRKIPRNARDSDTRFCGECNAGCLRGCKQSTMKTFLQDASDASAALLPNTDVREILVEAGRATGVRAICQTSDGDRETLVTAPVVVLAAGALMTPVILQASGVGGSATGENLHVHPSYFMSGVFEEDLKGWAGQILTSVCDEFDHVEGRHGFVIEAAPLGLGFWSGLTPWRDGRQHKLDLLRLRHVAGVWAFVRDHGAGKVTRDPEGMPFVSWGLDDPVDLRVVRAAHVELARILKAAGAQEIFTFLPGDPRWRAGEDFDSFLDQLASLDATDVLSLSAHQSGSCAVGTDPAVSVVDGESQLHDVKGVYVADASAFPTAPGVNPMVSIEAYASKVAGHILSGWGGE